MFVVGAGLLGRYRGALRLSLAFSACLLTASGAAASENNLSPAAEPRLRGSEQVLYTFDGADGTWPVGGLAVDRSGTLYGSTDYGGPLNTGVIFGLTPYRSHYNERTLYYQGLGRIEGGNFTAGIYADAHGDLYTPGAYGRGMGGVLKVSPIKAGLGVYYKPSTAYSFDGSVAGNEDYGALIAGKNGLLFGTSYNGGNTGCYGAGCGTVYALVPSKSGYSGSAIHTFEGGTDGAEPFGYLIEDSNGALYGTTSWGGNSQCFLGGCGTVYKLTPTASGYVESILYSFVGSPNDGQFPHSSLVADSGGALYGTTYNGGPDANGVVFKLTPVGSGYVESVIHYFAGPPGDGWLPLAGMAIDSAGNLYGTTYRGGTKDAGIFFELTRTGTGYAYTVLHNFQGVNDGANPLAPPIIYDHALYGTTQSGGPQGDGTVYRISL
jgi:uncharacterized repeat protein (TIGR03803 family)